MIIFDVLKRKGIGYRSKHKIVIACIKLCCFCINLYSTIYFWNVHLLTLFQYLEAGL